MKVNVKEVLEQCGLEEKLYPGKRAIKKMPQSGEHKSHCTVFDWRSPELLRVEVKAGLSGKDLEPKELRKFPVSFQSPTFIEIDTSAELNREEIEDDEEEEGSKGKGGGGKGQKKKKVEPNHALNAFSKMVEGKIPDMGEITRMVVMGKEIAKEAISSVLGILTAQIKAMTVTPVNIVAAARAVNVSVAQPGGGLSPKGHETVVYKYRGADMFDPSAKPG